MNETQLPTVATWLAEPLTKDVAQSLDRLRRAEDVRYVAVMPDVHLAADVCVGTVVATRELVYPAAIGGDIGCGMAAVAADADATLFANGQSAAKLLRGLAACVPGNKHSAKRPLTAELVAIGLSDPQLLKAADRDGRVQLGTLGRGNHFLEFQSDDEDRLWIMLHSGSRAMGQSITRFHLERARSPHSRLPALEARSQAGAAYLHDVTWARAYAAASRTAMLHATEELLLQLFHVATDWTTLIHTDHNHVELETHFAEPWLVHRKGAQRAAEGATAVIPGSMGT
ncbi:MAG: RtcB family protein, partial [Pirellulales bacterium]